MRDIPPLYQLQDENYFRNCREARLRRWGSEGQEWAEDGWTFRSRNRRSLHQSVGAMHQEDTSFAGCVCNEMMITTSWWCILTPHCHPQHVQQRIGHILIDLCSNIRFSPKLCRWAISRKTWRDSGELWSKTICCILWFWTNSLTIWRAVQAWMKTTTSIVFFRPMPMLGDPNFINTIERKKLQ